MCKIENAVGCAKLHHPPRDRVKDQLKYREIMVAENVEKDAKKTVKSIEINQRKTESPFKLL